MKPQNYYSIGDVSRICNISKKTLRYYDEIGLIITQRKDFNNYRYYSDDSLLAVAIIKYYKQMGFKLEEMREFIEGKKPDVYRTIQQAFMAKIIELEQEQEEIRHQHQSVRDWYDLILEAEQVIENASNDVAIRYVEPVELFFKEQIFKNNIKASIINLDFVNYVDSIGNKTSGPVILNFTSSQDRLENKMQSVKIMQKAIKPLTDEVRIKFGGHMHACCYHIGSHETINATYEKIFRWAKKHSYVCDAESFERYVTDYWTTRNSEQFVTEVMLRARRQC